MHCCPTWPIQDPNLLPSDVPLVILLPPPLSQMRFLHSPSNPVHISAQLSFPHSLRGTPPWILDKDGGSMPDPSFMCFSAEMPRPLKRMSEQCINRCVSTLAPPIFERSSNQPTNQPTNLPHRDPRLRPTFKIILGEVEVRRSLWP